MTTSVTRTDQYMKTNHTEDDRLKSTCAAHVHDLLGDDGTSWQSKQLLNTSRLLPQHEFLAGWGQVECSDDFLRVGQLVLHRFRRNSLLLVNDELALAFGALLRAVHARDVNRFESERLCLVWNESRLLLQVRGIRNRHSLVLRYNYK